MSASPVRIPPRLMRELRITLPAPTYGVRNYCTQAEAAHLLGVHVRSVERWEKGSEGSAPVSVGWAYVGVSYRLGDADAARRTLQRLTQLELPGSDVWGKA